MHIREINRADLPAVADVADKAFIESELNVWLYPKRHEFPDSWRARVLRSLKAALSKPGFYGFVCVTDDQDPAAWPRDTIVGYSWWDRQGPADDPLVSKWRQNNGGFFKILDRTLMSWELRYISFFGLDRSHSPERQDVFDKEGELLGDPFAPLSSYWSLSVLAVHPDWQGKGVGRRLMQWGLDRADEEKVPIALIASPAGRHFYKRIGFGTANWALTESITPWAEGGAVMVRDVEKRFTRAAVGDETTKEFFGKRKEIDMVYI